MYFGIFLSTSSLLFVFWEPLNYLKYFMVLPSILLIMQRIDGGILRFKASDSVAKFFLLLFAFATISLILTQSKFTAIDAIVYLNIALFSIAASFTTVNVARMYWIFLFYFALWLAQQVRLHGINDTLGSAGIFFNSSSGSVLKFSIISYIFGLFFIYFLTNKSSKKYLLLAVVGVIITSKRATAVALLLIIIIFYSPEAIKRIAFNVKTIIAINTSWLIMSLAIASDYFSNLVYETMGISASALTLGRNVIYKAAFDLHSNPWLSFFIGSGEGSTSTHLVKHPDLFYFDGLEKLLLHNEILRLYLEGGFPFFIVALILMYPRKPNDLAWSCLLYINIVSFFDNTLIYSLVWYYLIVIIASGQHSSAKEDQLGNKAFYALKKK